MNKITAPVGTKMIFEPCRDCYTGDESAFYGDETAIVIAGTDVPEASAANRKHSQTDSGAYGGADA